MAYRRVKFEKTKQTISSTNEDHYQVRHRSRLSAELADVEDNCRK